MWLCLWHSSLVMFNVDDYYYYYFFFKKQNYSKISHVRYLSPLYMLVPTKIKKWVGSPSNYLKEGYIIRGRYNIWINFMQGKLNMWHSTGQQIND
jgi:hypothetical protein